MEGVNYEKGESEGVSERKEEKSMNGKQQVKANKNKNWEQRNNKKDIKSKKRQLKKF